MVGARPVYISVNATKEEIENQVKLLWGFDTVVDLGVETEERPFVFGELNDSFCEFIIAGFSFEHMDDDANLFTVRGLDGTGTGKEEQYRFFHTFAYGGLSMVRVSDWEEFKLVPQFRFLQELNRMQGQVEDKSMFGAGMNSVTTLLRKRTRLEELDARLKAKEESVEEKRRASRDLLSVLRGSAFDAALVFTAFEDIPALKTPHLEELIKRAEEQALAAVQEADRIMSRIELREPERAKILLLEKEIDALRDRLQLERRRFIDQRETNTHLMTQLHNHDGTLNDVDNPPPHKKFKGQSSP